MKYIFGSDLERRIFITARKFKITPHQLYFHLSREDVDLIRSHNITPNI